MVRWPHRNGIPRYHDRDCASSTATSFAWLFLATDIGIIKLNYPPKDGVRVAVFLGFSYFVRSGSVLTRQIRPKNVGEGAEW